MSLDEYNEDDGTAGVREPRRPRPSDDFGAGDLSEAEDDLAQDDYSPEDELWPGGPTMGQIDAWKGEYEGVYVTSVSPTQHVVWRTINRFEYRRLVKLMEQAVASGTISQAQANLDNEEAVAELCILYPPYQRANPASQMAGLATLISTEVMEASAFSPLEVRKL